VERLPAPCVCAGRIEGFRFAQVLMLALHSSLCPAGRAGNSLNLVFTRLR
jgi:hypothetical protein